MMKATLTSCKWAMGFLCFARGVCQKDVRLRLIPEQNFVLSFKGLGKQKPPAASIEDKAK